MLAWTESLALMQMRCAMMAGQGCHLVAQGLQHLYLRRPHVVLCGAATLSPQQLQAAGLHSALPAAAEQYPLHMCKAEVLLAEDGVLQEGRITCGDMPCG
jgi:hypothetical protein